MHYTVLIPARLASTRLPNKPLADIGGAPMVVRVAQRAAQARGAAQVVVAADCAAIVQACLAHNVQAVLTDANHPSGSDRLAQACMLLGLPDESIVVNVQGDEPLIDTASIHAVAQLLAQHPQAAMGTAVHAIERMEDFVNPNVVKAVLDDAGYALYFSRAPIPYPRDAAHALPSPAPWRHIGLYAYRVGFLRAFPTLAQAPLERTESLEQLRALWHGRRIVVHRAAHAAAPGVDTPEDLAQVRALWAQDATLQRS
jgi:3-deoxy-manno-octulosonate cytidylyltransferase (CMP-KDO synthetase)